MDKNNENKFDQAVKVIADAEISAPAGFTTKVMAHLEERESNRFSWRNIMENIQRHSLRLSAAVGTCAVALFCIMIVQKEQGTYTRKETPTLTQSAPVEAGKNESTIAEIPQKPMESDEMSVDKNSAVEKRVIEAEEPLQDGAQAPKNDIAQALPSTQRTLGIHSGTRAVSPEQLQELYSNALQKGHVAEFASRRAPEGASGLYDQVYTLPLERSRERYQNYGENNPIMVSKEPVSTFSIDVDTGSYTNARRFLTNGQLPPKDAVRIEEFLNYFDYNYPSQSKDPFALSYEIAPNPFEQNKYLVKLGIAAQEIKEDRKPWNLVFLVDVSGSMNTPNKLPLLKQSLQFLTKNLQESDRVALVTYAGSSKVALESTPASEQGKILEAVENLQSGGSTYGSAGIQKAYELAKTGFQKGGVNRVIIATDGDFNVGITNQDDLIKLIEEKRQSNITLTTLGFGSGNYNEAMMEQLANKGNGNHFYIDNFREARKVFGEDLAGTLQVVAKDVKLQIEFNPDAVAQYRLIGYENRKLQNHEFNNDKIDAGEIGSGHTVTALYEVVLAGSPEAEKLATEHRYEKNKKEGATSSVKMPEEVAFLKIRYKEPNGSTSKLLRFPLLSKKIEKLGQASDDFTFAAAVSAFAHKLRKSSHAPDVNVSEIIAAAKKSRGTDENGNRAEFIHLMENVAATLK